MNTVNDALALAELGYRVFPCVAGDKRPGCAHGCLDATTDADQIAAWWTAAPDSNVAVSTDGLLVVDVDPLPDGSPNPWLPLAGADEMGQKSGAVSKTPRGGFHYWFRAPAGVDLRNTASKIAPAIDTRANGGYVLVAPSRTSDGLYHWVQELPAVAALPEPPGWLMDALNGDVAPKPQTAGEPAAAVTAIPEGQRNDVLYRWACGLRRNGLDEDEILASVRVRNAKLCKPPLDDDELRLIVRQSAKHEPDQASTAHTEDWAGQDAASGEIPPDDLGDDPGPLPAELLNPGGFLGEWMAWCLRTAPRPLPEFALAGALASLSILCGRKVRDEFGTRPNLYMACVADSSNGKDHSRKLLKRLLSDTGFSKCLLEETKSAAGIVNFLAVNPVRVMAWDEFGQAIAGMTSKGKNTGLLQQVLEVLLKIFTSVDSEYVQSAQADVKTAREPIREPFLTVLGSSTPDEFFGGLNAACIANGLLGRLIVFWGPDVRLSLKAPEPIPEPVAEFSKWWAAQKPEGNLHGTLNAVPAARLLCYSAAGRALIEQLTESCEDRREKLKDWERPLRGRQIEMTQRLAMLHSLSLFRDTQVIEADSVRWATAVIEHCMSRSVYHAKTRIASSDHGAKLKQVIAFILEKRQAGATMSQLAIRFQDIDSTYRTKLLQHAEDTGQVMKRETRGATGRSKTTYFGVRFARA